MDDFWSVLLRGPLTVVRPETVGVPVVVAATEAGTLVTYEQTVGEGDERETLTSERDGRFLMGGRSRWRLEGGGVAVDGPFEGTRLAQANDVSPEFFFAWLDLHPETEVYGLL
jgi:hypothetical protein